MSFLPITSIYKHIVTEIFLFCCSGMGKVQYQKTSCIHIIHPALLSLTTVTMDTRETGHKARDIPILRGKWTN